MFLSWSEDVHVFLGLSTFSTKFCQITVRIDTLWAQLLLEFSSDHFETMHTCSTLSVDVHVSATSPRVFYRSF